MSVRPFRAGDEDAFWRLRGRAFPDQDLAGERRRWAWQFADNPFALPGHAPGFVLCAEERLVGFIGRVPVPLVLDGREVVGFAATDWCVDPELQSHAAGLSLARRFLDDPETPFPFATAPFPGSLPVWRYCGASVLAGASEPCLWVHTGDPPPPPDGVEVEEWARFDARVDALAEVPAARWRVWTRRDRRYLDWRYVAWPGGRPRIHAAVDAAGALRGYAVSFVLAEGGHAYVPELLTRPGDGGAVKALLAAVLRSARDGGAAEVYLLHRDPEVHENLPGLGFQRVEGHGLGFFCGRRPGSPAVADWYLTAGDGDLLYSASLA